MIIKWSMNNDINLGRLQLLVALMINEQFTRFEMMRWKVRIVHPSYHQIVVSELKNIDFRHLVFII